MSYVDGFLLPVPVKNLAAYRKMAQLGAKVWMKHGALQYFECAGDDLKKTEWTLPFTSCMKVKEGETVFFSFIVFKSRAHRDKVNAKVMADPLMNDPEMMNKPMPFDMKRMYYGGFKAVVEY